MKKIMCLITALTLILSVPMVSDASGVYPDGDEYEVTIDYGSAYTLYFRDGSNALIQQIYNKAVLGQMYSNTYTTNGRMTTRCMFYLDDYLADYMPFISTASNVWISCICEDTYSLDVTLSTGTRSTTRLYYDYEVDGNGTTINADTFYIDSVAVPSRSTRWASYDFGSTFYGATELGLKVYFDNHFYTNSTSGTINYSLDSFAIVLYLEGVSGTDAEMYLVINAGLEDIESAVQEVKAEIQVMQGQLNNIEDSINQGFDGILTPDADDKAQADQFGSGMSDKVNQGGQILDQMGEMAKPDLDAVIGEDILSDTEVEAMGNLMAPVQPLLTSALIGRTILIGLILALLGYILFGKR